MDALHLVFVCVLKQCQADSAFVEQHTSDCFLQGWAEEQLYTPLCLKAKRLVHQSTQLSLSCPRYGKDSAGTRSGGKQTISDRLLDPPQIEDSLNGECDTWHVRGLQR